MLVDHLLESAVSMDSVQIPSRVKNCHWVFGGVISVSKLNSGTVVFRLPGCCFRKLCSNGLICSQKS